MKPLRAVPAVLLAALVLILAGAMTTTHEPSATFNQRMIAERRDYLGDVDGHPDCWSLVDATPYVLCRDGFSISS
ncbi:hypothetical protein ACIQK6_23745 [Streptomyces sp. NPDC091682]|uniref:hypothetical protein n=1 Tax=Streptomyces sp. NPDC091682 TaxID=3366005 RepID=UPI003804A6DA